MRRTLIALLAILMLATSTWAARRDPLSTEEADKLRDSAQEPGKRIPLFAEFARTRLSMVEQLRSDPRFAGDRARRIHDLLEDFTAIIDELGDNVASYDDRDMDLRKPLKKVIEALTEFQVKLRTIHELRADQQFSAEFREYSFPLETAIDAVNANLDDARKTLEVQEAERAKKKDTKGD